jgi:hypothetical protein
MSLAYLLNINMGFSIPGLEQIFWVFEMIGFKIQISSNIVICSNIYEVTNDWNFLHIGTSYNHDKLCDFILESRENDLLGYLHFRVYCIPLDKDLGLVYYTIDIKISCISWGAFAIGLNKDIYTFFFLLILECVKRTFF